MPAPHPPRLHTVKLAILDRDGTLNAVQPGEFVTCPDEWVPLPGALEAVARLNHAGWHVVVATNQPGLGRGLFDVDALNAIHAKMHRKLASAGARLDAVFFCPHAPDEGCRCHKPAPGLLEQICERYAADPREVHVVGGSLDHLLAGAAIGAHLHAVGTGSLAPLRPGQPWPAGLPQGCTFHEGLGDWVDQVLPGAAPAAPLPVPLAAPDLLSKK